MYPFVQRTFSSFSVFYMFKVFPVLGYVVAGQPIAIPLRLRENNAPYIHGSVPGLSGEQ